MKQIDRIADCDVHVQDLDAMILESKMRGANRQLLQAFKHDEAGYARTSANERRTGGNTC